MRIEISKILHTKKSIYHTQKKKIKEFFKPHYCLKSESIAKYLSNCKDKIFPQKKILIQIIETPIEF